MDFSAFSQLFQFSKDYDDVQRFVNDKKEWSSWMKEYPDAYRISEVLAEIFALGHCTVKQLREKTHLSKAEFSRRYMQPLRTLENYEYGTRRVPDFLLLMVSYTILNSENESFLYRDPFSGPFPAKRKYTESEMFQIFHEALALYEYSASALSSPDPEPVDMIAYNSFVCKFKESYLKANDEMRLDDGVEETIRGIALDFYRKVLGEKIVPDDGRYTSIFVAWAITAEDWKHKKFTFKLIEF